MQILATIKLAFQAFLELPSLIQEIRNLIEMWNKHRDQEFDKIASELRQKIRDANGREDFKSAAEDLHKLISKS